MSDPLQEILEHARKTRGVDFSSYRTGTIRRRLETRLYATGMTDYPSYYEYLRGEPGEMNALIEALTIKVSRFFRDPLVFEVLRETVFPELLHTFGGDSLRIWSAGCARGEEPYSVALLLREMSEKEGEWPDTFIIATDIDTESLDAARTAVYRDEALTNVRKGHLDRYFSAGNGFHRLREEIRSMVTFSYHDVMTGFPPKEGVFSDYHLILCRNVLIYLESPAQERVMKCFMESLAEGGYLILGKAETPAFDSAKSLRRETFPVNIFRKRGRK
ncbi:MAG: protein-glutamate O-methyltransferase CheR [Alphaproteobacteria bacterium]|uniref:protein-glutamate O-methyltransferase n=1 Tax=Candidatus Nitrobium versatile TaxID=2884831 RepID=A0A953JB92_9BACT|nr:protein-glutamate O-methyltransferase CheR [Candidatus Nitrobium versatile]